MAALQSSGRGNYRLTWRGSAVATQYKAALNAELNGVASDMLTWLKTNLHRVTGDMANQAYANVGVVGSRRVVRAGSTSDHSFWHEMRYHAQFRQCMDIFVPRAQEAARRAMERVRVT